MFKFNIDTPTGTSISKLSSFSGWYIPESKKTAKLNFYINDQPCFSLSHGLDRPDVAAAFPEKEGSLNSGFFGNVILPDSVKLGEELVCKIIDENDHKTVLYQNKFTVNDLGSTSQPRKRDFQLENLLSFPNYNGNLSFNELEKLHLSDCDLYIRGTTLHVLQKGEQPFVRLTENETTHPYSQDALDILERVNNGIVLDFGAGNTPKEHLHPNVCYLDVQQYIHTDIVCTTLKLPFRDNCFDAVVSQAVFEHIPNPFVTAKELYRILKPGGIVHIDTAFMQPLHGDPSHYFNMTLNALRLVMSDFEELRGGIKPYQYPSFGLMMQIQAVLPYINSGKWKERLEELHQLIVKEGNLLDKDLGIKGQEILAAGVFFEGKKSV
ncbi:class I SAM-dependent methyltransferase [Mastigocoleus testarum]|uniref:Methyltransferase type 11 domain-containing protein n=1 Tax=Mastigocoleus testarum BC008 TaxID=371196 RepID=A0A0V7ZRQ5_9CYAN|nr:class I SAM-dependent methyltransferase [Mastigocoleus testarum]KST67356.1 hypothetical protein BC008_29615 [Mastigocoleus testarum BC008]